MGNFKQVALKRALQWNKTPSTLTTFHPSTSKTKVVVDIEGTGLGVSESDTFIAGPNFFKDARCGLATCKGPIDANGKEHNSGFLCESSYTITFNHKCKCLTCDTDHLVFQGICQGTVILSDQYAPVMVGSNGKCIPVLRIVDANTELKCSLREDSSTTRQYMSGVVQ